MTSSASLLLNPNGSHGPRRNLLGFIFFGLALIAMLTVGGCASGPGGQVAPNVQTQGAQTVGNDQGSAQASESISAQTHITPVINNIFGAKSVEVTTTPDGGSSTKVEGSTESQITVSAATMGNFNMNESDVKTSGSSGGGAAGGTGGAERTVGTQTGGNASGTAPASGGGGQ